MKSKNKCLALLIISISPHLSVHCSWCTIDLALIKYCFVWVVYYCLNLPIVCHTHHTSENVKPPFHNAGLSLSHRSCPPPPLTNPNPNLTLFHLHCFHTECWGTTIAKYFQPEQAVLTELMHLTGSKTVTHTTTVWDQCRLLY